MRGHLLYVAERRCPIPLHASPPLPIPLHPPFRSFGDLERADTDDGALRKPAGLISEPEIVSEPLRSSDEFVVLASDGLWDVMAPDEAVRLARSELRAYEDAQMAAEKLIEVGVAVACTPAAWDVTTLPHPPPSYPILPHPTPPYPSPASPLPSVAHTSAAP